MVIKLKHSIVLMFSLLIILSAQWPVSQETIEVGFGALYQNRYSTSLQFNSIAEPIVPYDAGEVIFYQDESHFSNNSLSERNLLIIHHSKEYRTLYSNFDARIETKNRLHVENSVTLGNTSGKSEFSIYDTELEQWISPYLMLPVMDKLFNIDQFINPALISNSEEFPLVDGLTVSSSNYVLQFSINENLNLPRRVKISHLGQTLCDYTFESLKMVDGELLLNGINCLTPDSVWFTNNRFISSNVLLIPGRAVFEITIEDQNGKESKVRYIINVLQR